MAIGITLLIGPPACGKNSYAQNEIQRLKGQGVVVCRDNFREMLVGGNIHQYRFKSDIEDIITKAELETAILSLSIGKHVFVADTNLNPKTQDAWKTFAKEQKVAFHKKDFFNDYYMQNQALAQEIGPEFVVEKFRKQCLEWNLKRLASVPSDVINKMIDDYIVPKYSSVVNYTGTKDKPNAIIVDLDGTLFHMKDRGPFEWDKVHTDTIDEFVRETIILYKNAGYKIIACSGRDEVCKALSLQSLQQYNVPIDEFFIRSAGDQRPDWKVKDEIFWNSIAPNYNVRLCLDDRNQVVNRYRAMGIKVYQVQPGNF